MVGRMKIDLVNSMTKPVMGMKYRLVFVGSEAELNGIPGASQVAKGGQVGCRPARALTFSALIKRPVLSVHIVVFQRGGLVENLVSNCQIGIGAIVVTHGIWFRLVGIHGYLPVPVNPCMQKQTIESTSGCCLSGLLV